MKGNSKLHPKHQFCRSKRRQRGRGGGEKRALLGKESSLAIDKTEQSPGSQEGKGIKEARGMPCGTP